MGLRRFFYFPIQKWVAVTGFALTFLGMGILLFTSPLAKMWIGLPMGIVLFLWLAAGLTNKMQIASTIVLDGDMLPHECNESGKFSMFTMLCWMVLMFMPHHSLPSLNGVALAGMFFLLVPMPLADVYNLAFWVWYKRRMAQ